MASGLSIFAKRPGPAAFDDTVYACRPTMYVYVQSLCYDESTLCCLPAYWLPRSPLISQRPSFLLAALRFRRCPINEEGEEDEEHFAWTARSFM